MNEIKLPRYFDLIEYVFHNYANFIQTKFGCKTLFVKEKSFMRRYSSFYD